LLVLKCEELSKVIFQSEIRQQNYFLKTFSELFWTSLNLEDCWVFCYTLVFVLKCQELSKAIFKIETGQKMFLFSGGLFILIYFRRKYRKLYYTVKSDQKSLLHCSLLHLLPVDGKHEKVCDCAFISVCVNLDKLL
jgi:hypothetical protein